MASTLSEPQSTGLLLLGSHQDTGVGDVCGVTGKSLRQDCCRCGQDQHETGSARESSSVFDSSVWAVQRHLWTPLRTLPLSPDVIECSQMQAFIS